MFWDYAGFGLLAVCAVSGLTGIALLLADKIKPKRKKHACWECPHWEPMAMDVGVCMATRRICRAGKRACENERRGM